jgi:transposase
MAPVTIEAVSFQTPNLK